MAPRSAEDGARAIAWGYLSPKVHCDLPCDLIRCDYCLPPESAHPLDALKQTLVQTATACT